MAGFFEQELEIFSIDKLESRPYEFDNHVWLSISFMRDLDLYRIQREVPEVTGFISDVGGFMGATASFMTFVFGILNY